MDAAEGGLCDETFALLCLSVCVFVWFCLVGVFFEVFGAKIGES